ncbi:MAG: TetR/AcrR family transcriptional regulator [Thermoguttaceae bacterium]|nr:TetR/AcrR family transcriptional regulator [Thermoguttaceae bacterium]
MEEVTPNTTSRGQKRCEKMLDVATQLFLKNGVAETSITEIVRRSGGSLATIYKFFGDKKGLFVAVCERQIRKRAIQVFSETLPPDPADAIPMILHKMHHQLLSLEMLQMIRMVLTEKKHLPDLHDEIIQKIDLRMLRPMIQFLTQAQNDGYLTGCSPERLTQVMVCMLRGTAMEMLIRNPDERVLQQRRQESLTLMLEVLEKLTLIPFRMESVDANQTPKPLTENPL